MTEELDRRLRDWGASSTPPVDGAFANRLEADLRLQAAEGATVAPPWWSMLLRPSVVAVALVVIGGIAGFFLLDSEPDGVIMVASEGGTVSVSVPGSPTTVVGAAGLDLPDGTEVRVGPGGVAIVDGVVLTPGSIARIDDGTLEVIEIEARDLVDPTTTVVVDTDDVAPTTIEPPATTAAPTTAAPTTRPTTVDSDTVDRPATTAPPTTLGPDEPSTTAPEPSVAPDPDRTTSTTEAKPTTTTAAPTEPVPVRLAVGEVVRRQVNLVWGADPNDAIAGWVVFERRGDTVRRVAIVRNVNATRLRVEVPGPLVQWRVRAITAGGEPVGQSPWVGLSG